jgi:hypothetical protein
MVILDIFTHWRPTFDSMAYVVNFDPPDVFPGESFAASSWQRLYTPDHRRYRDLDEAYREMCSRHGWARHI